MSTRCPSLYELMQQGLVTIPMGMVAPTPATSDRCFGLREPFLSWCRNLGVLDPGPFDPAAPNRTTRPSAQPQFPTLPLAPVQFLPTLQIKVGVARPPEFDPEIFRALQELDRSHRQGGGSMTTITDWFRTPEENLRQGGVANSLHLRGLAFDLRADEGGAATAAAWRRRGLSIVPPSSYPQNPHWHLEYEVA